MYTYTQTPTEPGWYPDPQMPAQLRYWDGWMWTDETQLPQTAAPQRGSRRVPRAALVGLAAATVAAALVGAVVLAGPFGGDAAADTATPPPAVEESQPPTPEESAPPQAERPADSALDDAFASTVVVHQYDDQGGYAVGAAVAIDGTTFLTAEHVVDSGDSAELVLQDGTTLDGVVTKRDVARDLALIETEPHGLPTADVATSDPEVGEQVWAFGAPNDYVQISEGRVTSVHDDSGDGVREVETDTSVRPGNSGGPLVRGDGDIVGIVSYRYEGDETFGYTIAASEIREFLSA